MGNTVSPKKNSITIKDSRELSMGNKKTNRHSLALAIESKNQSVTAFAHLENFESLKSYNLNIDELYESQI